MCLSASQTRASSVRYARSLLTSARFARALRFPGVLWSYPKSGSTWVRFILHSLYVGEPASSFDEVNAQLCDIESLLPARSWQGFATCSPPVTERLVKSHDMPPPFFSSRRQVVFVVRHPAKVLSSLGDHLSRMQGVNVTANELIAELSESSLVNYGTWGSHVDRFRSLPRAERFLIKYEDLVEDPVPVIADLCRFLNLTKDERQIESALVSSTKERMRSAESASLRRGEFGFVGSAPRGFESVDFTNAVQGIERERLEWLGYPV